MQEKIRNIKSAIFGHAVGDALGVPVEFCFRAYLDANPVTTMRGFGTFPYPAGTWSDDTSMTLACLDSLSNGVNYDDIMTKFCEWFENANYTPSGETFDIGGTTKKSLLAYLISNIPALECGQGSEWDNGNGSLMRIIPIILYLNYSQLNSLSIEEKIKYIENVSSLTHAHIRSQIGCGIYAFVMTELLHNKCKESVYNGIIAADRYYEKVPESQSYSRILNNNIALLSRDEISSSGYVVDCLEAALWCLLTTDSYEACVLKAVNLGDDSDTTAAVAGGLAGILYGFNKIPKKWLDLLQKKDYIENLCVTAALKWQKGTIYKLS